MLLTNTNIYYLKQFLYTYCQTKQKIEEEKPDYYNVPPQVARIKLCF